MMFSAFIYWEGQFNIWINGYPMPWHINLKKFKWQCFKSILSSIVLVRDTDFVLKVWE